MKQLLDITPPKKIRQGRYYSHTKYKGKKPQGYESNQHFEPNQTRLLKLRIDYPVKNNN